MTERSVFILSRRSSLFSVCLICVWLDPGCQAQLHFVAALYFPWVFGISAASYPFSPNTWVGASGWGQEREGLRHFQSLPSRMGSTQPFASQT